MCALLPWWDAWVAPATSMVVVLLLAALSLELLRRHALRKLGRVGSASWTERARVAFELRQVGLASATSWAVVAAMHCSYSKSASGCSSGDLPFALALGLIVGLYLRLHGAIQARYQGGGQPFSARVRSFAASLVVVRPAFLVTIAAVAASGLAPVDARVWGWVLAVAVLHYAAGTLLSYPVGRWLGLVKPARAEVVRAVERAREQLPTKVTSVDELAWLMPNALAYPLQNRVAFTVAAADQLSFDDLHAIALHELGHLHESAWLRWFRPAQGLALLPVAVAVPLVRSGERLGLFLLIFFSFALLLFAVRLSRKHETDADTHAAAHSSAYAQALENLYRLAGIPAVLSKRTTHPSLYDRMLAAGVTPSYPRPKPPGRWTVVVPLLLVVPVLVLLEVGRGLQQDVWVRLAPEADAPYLRVALNGTRDDLVELAARVYGTQPALARFLVDRAYPSQSGERRARAR